MCKHKFHLKNKLYKNVIVALHKQNFKKMSEYAFSMQETCAISHQISAFFVRNKVCPNGYCDAEVDSRRSSVAKLYYLHGHRQTDETEGCVFRTHRISLYQCTAALKQLGNRAEIWRTEVVYVSAVSKVRKLVRSCIRIVRNVTLPWMSSAWRR